MELGQLEVGLGATRIDPKDLAAEGDGVVEKALIGVEVYCPFVGTDRLGGVVDLEVEVSDPIVQGQIGAGLGPRLGLLNGFQIYVDGFPPILLLLKLARRILQLFQIHAARAEKGDRG